MNIILDFFFFQLVGDASALKPNTAVRILSSELVSRIQTNYAHPDPQTWGSPRMHPKTPEQKRNVSVIKIRDDKNKQS